ncbi:MAG: 16S rRNA (uracil(1498)-N(3))-methyltransferase [Sulfurimonas sp.]|jgi:16S rRNA (uracil1498-N3)-methyltransferase|nr:16S rRNA (uracil(1498)-N(3))-methyltransferase [Sulfurimonadaceae bacterium]
MIFSFCDSAGEQNLTIKDELFRYIIKARRHKIGDIIAFRNKDELNRLHSYELLAINPKTADFKLVESKTYEVKPKKYLHIGWCKVDVGSIEKALPSLCEMGVSKITFVSCDRSQRNFRLDFKRFNRIVEASMQQSGRSDMLEFAESKSVLEFLKEYPNALVFDFASEVFNGEARDVLIGCEGGFSEDERELFKNICSFDSNMILKSESAVLAVASKVLL